MRKLFILPLLFFLLLIGCGEGRTDYMRALLHEQDSLNRAYKHLSLDTIRQLTDYFDHHGTNYDRMHAHYLLGSVYRDMGEAPASLAAFQHAIEVADTTAGGDSIYALLAKVHGQMGTILIKQYLPNEAAKEFRLASRYSLMNNDTIDALQRKLGVLHCLKLLNLEDSVLSETNRLQTMLIDLHHPEIAAQILSPATRLWLERGNYVKAKDLLDKYLSISDTTESSRRQSVAYHYLFGEYYLGVGQLDSAEYHFRSELAEGKGIGHQVRALRGLYHLYSKKVIVDSLIKYTAAYNDLNDSSNIMRDSETMLNMQSLYDYSRHEKEAMEKTVVAQHLRMILICSAFLILIGGGFLYLAYKRKKKESMETLARLEEKYYLNIHHANKLEEELEVTKGQMGEMAAEKEGELQQLQSIIAEQERQLNIFLGKHINKTDAYLRLKKCGNIGEKAGTIELLQFKEIVKRNLPAFYKKMNSFEYKMNFQEEMICIFIKTGFHTNEIANILGYSSSGIANIKSRLLEKLYHVTLKASELDNIIFAEW